MITFSGDRNTAGKHDFAGAFQPESEAFQKLHGGDLFPIDISKPAAVMRARVLEKIRDASELTRVAFFCHGFATGIQLGFKLPHVAELAKTIAASGTVSPNITLYACSTGAGGVGGDGGFADKLRDALCTAGATQCRVDALTTAAHATRNPYVRRFEGQGSPVGGTGGQWLVAPGSKLWPAWKAALQKTDLRFLFPTMSVAEIHAELLATKGP